MAAEKIDFAAPRLSVAEAPPGPALSEAELLALITEHVGAPIAVISTGLHFLYVNQSFAGWFGLEPQHIVGRPIREIYGEHNHARYMPYLQRAFAGDTVRYQRQVRNPTGREEWHTVCLTPCRDRDGEVFAIATAALDVHELRVTTEALRAANQRLSSHMENSPLAVLEMDSGFHIVHCSARAAELFGWQPDEVKGRPLPALLALDGASELSQALQRLHRQQEARNRAEARHVRADGTVMHCEWFNSALTDAQGQLSSIMALAQDVSSRVVAAQQLRQRAERDSLTGLLNRGAFQSLLAASLERARDDDAAVRTLLFIDLDGFKAVNDSLGHAAGDGVLCAVAERLAGVLRPDDVLARLGGDEFAVLLETDAPDEAVASMCRRIQQAMESPFAAGEPKTQVQVGASIGVAQHPPLPGDALGLIMQADRAMYEAKRAGKGCVRYARA